MGAPATFVPEGSLEASYRRCRALAKRHGTTYYLSTFLLPRDAWRHVWALYAFCRCADEIVDETGPIPVAERERALRAWGDRFFANLAAGSSDHPVLRAVVATVASHDIDPDCFRRFLASMAMDLTVTSYATWDDLLGYMDGSAAVIGTMMLPILGARDPAAAREPARQLGLAFQLTNFIRDVAEDLDRGRVYLPEEHLARFGVTRADLDRREATPEIKGLIRYEAAQAKEHYAAAAPGIPMLEPASQACMRTAFALYGGILDEVAAADYDVFVRRATVPNRRRAVVAVRSLLTRRGTPIEVAAA